MQFLLATAHYHHVLQLATSVPFNFPAAAAFWFTSFNLAPPPPPPPPSRPISHMSLLASDIFVIFVHIRSANGARRANYPGIKSSTTRDDFRTRCRRFFRRRGAPFVRIIFASIEFHVWQFTVLCHTVTSSHESFSGKHCILHCMLAVIKRPVAWKRVRFCSEPSRWHRRHSMQMRARCGSP